MKTPAQVGRLIARTSFLFSFSLMSANLMAEDAAPAATPAVSAAPAAAAEPKSHTLFMGTDITIEYEKKLYRVQDVFSTNFIISVDGQKTSVPMHGAPRKMKLEQSLKLTNVSASLTGLKVERSYTAGNNPKMARQIEASHAANAIDDNASLAEGRYIVAMNKFGSAFNADSPNAGVDKSIAQLDAAAADAAKSALAARQMADAQYNTDFTNSGLAQLRANSDLAEERYDAVEVDFEVSSPTELKSPYVVLVVNYHPRGKPEITRDLIYARALEALGSRPEKIHFVQGGLPVGFELENYQLHLYDLGNEVATEVVPKRVPLTREEAFEYVKADYLGTHKGATLPSIPAMGKLGMQVRVQLTTAQMNGTYYVKVDQNGKPIEAFTDEACSQPVDDAVGSVIKSVRFFPALEKGKRVQGVARLTFSHLTR